MKITKDPFMRKTTTTKTSGYDSVTEGPHFKVGNRVNFLTFDFMTLQNRSIHDRSSLSIWSVISSSNVLVFSYL